MKRQSLFLFLVVLFFSFHLSASAANPKREFRGAWIQCVNGQYIGKTPSQIRSMLSAQLDSLQLCGINAILFQVRAEGDALYRSSYEPWSRYLTGTQGTAPADGWDPLAWMVEQCHNRQKECHYLIILGAQVNGRRITDSLQRRLDCALSYLSRHPKTRVVVSGGQGEKEERTEADAMEEYLLCHGIEKHRIILEERSRTTRENLLYSMELIGDRTEPVGIVSNNFHLYRACSYARQLGYTDPCPVKADCHPVLFMNYMVRECLAVWKMWMIKLLTKNLTVL